MRSSVSFHSTAPAYSGRYLSANVDFPEPLGPATTWHIGLVSSFIFLYYIKNIGGLGVLFTASTKLGNFQENIHYNEIKHIGTENFTSAISPHAQGATPYFPTRRRSRLGCRPRR